MRRLLGGLSLGIFALVAGCGEVHPSTNVVSDLSIPSDMDPLTDQAVFVGPDMVTTLAPPPNCTLKAGVTGKQAWTALATTNGMRCAGGNCHNNNISPNFSTQATFMAVTVSQRSTAGIPYIAPNNPSMSFVLYKLRNLQGNVRNGGGSQMPKSGTLLTDAENCTLYNWVLYGAPTQ